MLNTVDNSNIVIFTCASILVQASKHTVAYAYLFISMSNRRHCAEQKAIKIVEIGPLMAELPHCQTWSIIALSLILSKIDEID